MQNHYISSRREPFSLCQFHFKGSVFWANAMFCLPQQSVCSVLLHLSEGCSVRIYLYLALQVRQLQLDFFTLTRSLAAYKQAAGCLTQSALDFSRFCFARFRAVHSRFNGNVGSLRSIRHILYRSFFSIFHQRGPTFVSKSSYNVSTDSR